MEFYAYIFLLVAKRMLVVIAENKYFLPSVYHNPDSFYVNMKINDCVGWREELFAVEMNVVCRWRKEEDTLSLVKAGGEKPLTFGVHLTIQLYHNIFIFLLTFFFFLLTFSFFFFYIF